MMMGRKGRTRLKPLDIIAGKTGYRYGGAPDSTLATQAQAYMQYRKMLYEWALARFDWEGLPSTIDERYLEACLINGQLVTFYEDKILGAFLAPKAVTVGSTNIYGNPTKFRTVAQGNYRSVDLSAKNCVPIYGSFSRYPDLPTIEFYAHQLAETSISLSVTRKAMRISRIITCDEGQRLTYMNIMNDVEDGRPIVFGANQLDLASIQTLDMQINPATIERLRLELGRVYNEAATALGIVNNSNDKGERLISDEVEYDSGKTMAARTSALRVRQDAADRINRKFGLDITVTWAASSPSIDPVNGGGV